MLQLVTVIVGLTFLFGFGNVLAFGLRLGVPGWVALLVAPAVDLSVLALLIAIRQLSLRGASADVIRQARRLLLVSSVGQHRFVVHDWLVGETVAYSRTRPGRAPRRWEEA